MQTVQTLKEQFKQVLNCLPFHRDLYDKCIKNEILGLRYISNGAQLTERLTSYNRKTTLYYKEY